MKPYYQDEFSTVYHGDCREILPQIPDASVDMVLTDPPYGHGNQDGDLQSSRIGVRGARQAAAESILNDGSECLPMLQEVFALLPRILMPDCCFCCCCCGGGGPTPTFAWFANQLDLTPWLFFHALVWDKSARGNGMGWRYRRNYEFIMVSHLAGGKLLWAEDSAAVPNILRHAPPTNRSHPNEKPVSLFSDLIRWHGPQTILDPFMGVGSTLVAAKQLGRKCIGIELEEKYCEIAARRLEQEYLVFTPEPTPSAPEAELAL